MSDTPITDKACGWPVGHHGRIDSSDLKLSPDGPFVHSSVAREVERENAALREKFMFAESEIILLREEREELREDKERLDWLDQKIVSSWLAGKDFVVWDKSSPQPCSIREWLDAARKEAQP